jgi:7,8-dihydropterin-6-yl-methyl-4-(beta-D-ribofuranosyl)aminobenzene 5'-phosphate synthase
MGRFSRNPNTLALRLAWGQVPGLSHITRIVTISQGLIPARDLSCSRAFGLYNTGMNPMQQAQNPAGPMLNELAITVIHDNYPGVAALKMAWGFSALVTGPEKTILFDTGSDGTLLLDNMTRLRIDPGRIDTVVLSHIHGDHTGGLMGFLKANPRVSVYLPASFPARFKDVVRGYGASVTAASEPQEVCRDVYTTGILGRRVKEQALVVRTVPGLVVLTGCAHPGIVKILEKATLLHGEPVLLLMGGFHLEWSMRRKLEKIVAAFRAHSVRHIAPTHCSSDKARQFFQQRYGPQYIELGVGKTVILADLK